MGVERNVRRRKYIKGGIVYKRPHLITPVVYIHCTEVTYSNLIHGGGVQWARNMNCPG